MTSITVLRAGALGDVLLTIPALHALRTRFPGAHLRVIGYRSLWQVAAPLIDELLSIDAAPFTALFASPSGIELPPALLDADIVVAWTAHTIALYPDAHVTVASPLPPPHVHASQWLLDTLAPLHLNVSPPTHNLLQLTEEERTRAREEQRTMGLHRPIVLHPGAGAVWKRWPAHRFARLAASLQTEDRPVALLNGPADGEAVAAVQALLPRPLPEIYQPDLRRLAAFLAEAGSFVGHDSGPSHLAALAGASVVALFGPTDPANWAPLGNTRILRRCATQSRSQGTLRTCSDPACLEAITVEDVQGAIASLQNST